LRNFAIQKHDRIFGAGAPDAEFDVMRRGRRWCRRWRLDRLRPDVRHGTGRRDDRRLRAILIEELTLALLKVFEIAQ